MGKDVANTGSLGPEGLPKLGDSFKGNNGISSPAGGLKGTQTKKGIVFTAFPSDARPNPYAGLNFDTNPYRNAILQKTFKGHMMSISAIAMHPKRSICATASDDFTWKVKNYSDYQAS